LKIKNCSLISAGKEASRDTSNRAEHRMAVGDNNCILDSGAWCMAASIAIMHFQEDKELQVGRVWNCDGNGDTLCDWNVFVRVCRSARG
jgi:hypothetical protein